MIQRRNDDFLKTRARQVRRCINGVDSTAKPAWISRTGSGRVVVEKEMYGLFLVEFFKIL